MTKLRTWLFVGALVAIVASSVAATRPKTISASKVKGTPDAATLNRRGMSLWKDGDGFHVRWNTDSVPTLFTGRIDTDKPIKEMKRVFEQGSGWVKLSGDRIVLFSSTTRGTLDGFDLLVPGGSRIRLEMTIDGKQPEPQMVFMGKNGINPPGFPLLIRLR